MGSLGALSISFDYPKRVKVDIVGISYLHIRLCNSRVSQGMFRFLEGKYQGFKRTRELELLGGG